MKHFLKNLACFAITITIAYTAIAFIVLEPNPLQWFWVARMFFTISVVLIAIPLLFIDENPK